MTSTGGTPYLALRPLLTDYVLSMPRGAAAVLSERLGAVSWGMADVFPGARVVEAAPAPRAPTCSLLRAVGNTVRSCRTSAARTSRPWPRRMSSASSASRTRPGRLVVGDLVESLDVTEVDRFVLDMLDHGSASTRSPTAAPWRCGLRECRRRPSSRPGWWRRFARLPFHRAVLDGDDAADLARRGSVPCVPTHRMILVTPVSR